MGGTWPHRLSPLLASPEESRPRLEMSQIKVTLGTEGQAARSLRQPWLSHKGNKTQKPSAGQVSPCLTLDPFLPTRASWQPSITVSPRPRDLTPLAHGLRATSSPELAK